MKTVFLREHFSIKKGSETFVGPCEIELTEQEIQDNLHKIHEIDEEIPESGETKKSKKKKDE